MGLARSVYGTCSGMALKGSTPTVCNHATPHSHTHTGRMRLIGCIRHPVWNSSVTGPAQIGRIVYLRLLSTALARLIPACPARSPGVELWLRLGLRGWGCFRLLAPELKKSLLPQPSSRLRFGGQPAGIGVNRSPVAEFIAIVA